jgi:hypothetical protein
MIENNTPGGREYQPKSFGGRNMRKDVNKREKNKKMGRKIVKYKQNR